MKEDIVYTVGHSNFKIEEFIELIKKHGINCIIDVRTIPSSNYNPQFNQMPITASLKEHGITYLHFGKEFILYRKDSLNEEGKVDFELAVQTPLFQEGVNRLKRGMELGYRIALMCAKSKPLECHRFSMVSRYLNDNGFTVRHILRNGELATQEDIEKVMVNEYVSKKKLREIDQMFCEYDATQQLRDAYRLKNKELNSSPEAKIESKE